MGKNVRNRQWCRQILAETDKPLTTQEVLNGIEKMLEENRAKRRRSRKEASYWLPNVRRLSMVMSRDPLIGKGADRRTKGEGVRITWRLKA